MNSFEGTRHLFRNICRMEGKPKGGSTYKRTKYIDGIEKKFTDRPNTEKVCAQKRRENTISWEKEIVRVY